MQVRGKGTSTHACLLLAINLSVPLLHLPPLVLPCPLCRLTHQVNPAAAADDSSTTGAPIKAGQDTAGNLQHIHTGGWMGEQVAERERELLMRAADCESAASVQGHSQLQLQLRADKTATRVCWVSTFQVCWLSFINSCRDTGRHAASLNSC